MACWMAQIPMTLSEVEVYFCSYDWQSASRGPSAAAELFVNYVYSVRCVRRKRHEHMRKSEVKNIGPTTVWLIYLDDCCLFSIL